MKSKAELLEFVYSHLISLSVFTLDNPYRIKLFAKDLKGKERTRNNYVRDKFIEINCLYHSFENNNLISIINVNIQSEDTEWIEEVRDYLRTVLDFLVIDGIVFYRGYGSLFRVSKTLTMSNDRYELRNDNINHSETTYMEGFWNTYKDNV